MTTVAHLIAAGVPWGLLTGLTVDEAHHVATVTAPSGIGGA